MQIGVGAVGRFEERDTLAEPRKNLLRTPNADARVVGELLRERFVPRLRLRRSTRLGEQIGLRELGVDARALRALRKRSHRTDVSLHPAHGRVELPGLEEIGLVVRLRDRERLGSRRGIRRRLRIIDRERHARDREPITGAELAGGALLDLVPNLLRVRRVFARLERDGDDLEVFGLEAAMTEHARREVANLLLRLVRDRDQQRGIEGGISARLSVHVDRLRELLEAPCRRPEAQEQRLGFVVIGRGRSECDRLEHEERLEESAEARVQARLVVEIPSELRAIEPTA